jgi:16S rRNA (cytosine1402-N4)-methyltransferase
VGHVPVLLEAAVDALNVRDSGSYVDATFGRGGHSRAILERLGPAGRLLALDADPEAIEHGRERFGGDARVTLLHGNFRDLVAAVGDLAGRVDGVLMDLGVSSPQLDAPQRGFSFRADGPLDMRLDPSSGRSAADWLGDVESDELAAVIAAFGEERFARRIARAIAAERERSPIRTTARLAEVVRDAIPAAVARSSRIDPATRTFQALRIAVNRELDALDEALAGAIDVLAPGGRLVVISFHSLEDRRVKRAIRAASTPPPASRRAPAAGLFRPRLKRVGGLVRPEAAEAAANPRARSARMRVAERISDAEVVP